MEIKVYATLREKVGSKTVTFPQKSKMTVAQIIEALFAQYPTVRAELLTRNGDLHSAFHFFINGRDARYLDGLDTVITEKDDVRIFPPVGGGIV